MYADVESAVCWLDWEVSCAFGLRESFFGRPDCARWLEGVKGDKHVGGYFGGKCGQVYGGSRGQQFNKGNGY